MLQNYVIKAKPRAGKLLPKVWLEGKRLLTNGFLPAVRYDVAPLVGSVGIELTLAENGKYKVSGKNDRPIIELTGGVLRTNGLEAGVPVLVIYTAGSIVITTD
jgi:hypothetical protein